MAYDELIQRYAAQFNVPEALIRAVITVESSWKSTAYRAEPKIKDASYGLMQLLSRTASWIFGRSLSASELYDPATNIEGGTKYLRYQLTRYDGNMEAAVAAYNAGTAYQKNGKYVNQNYVDKVMYWFQHFSSGADVGTSSPSSGRGGNLSPEPDDDKSSGSVLLIALATLAGMILLKKIVG